MTSAPRYLDSIQRDEIAHLMSGFTARSEWPTWLLIVLIPSGWIFGAWCYTAAAPLIGIVVMIWFTAWYMSLQHELLHGHPTRYRTINALLGALPLGMCYPFSLYRRSHLAHHIHEHLTHPQLDPESYYCPRERWRLASVPLRLLLRANKTLLGRLMLGPLIAVVGLASEQARLLLRGDSSSWLVWSTQAVLCALMLVGLSHYAAISPLSYIALVAYPALSLSMLRSFYEHRPALESAQRCTLNETCLPLALLFLHNNLHLVHHDLPGVPWFLLPIIYRRRREAYVSRSGNFLESGYASLSRRFALREVDAPWHPYH